MMKLDVRGKGKCLYDYEGDVILFKADREYAHSLDFDDIIVDIDSKGFPTAIQVFDASKEFKVSKEALNKLEHFEFLNRIEGKKVSAKLKFSVPQKNQMLVCSQSFTNIYSKKLKDAEVVCSA